jgi:sphingomyelin phosphodiesterase
MQLRILAYNVFLLWCDSNPCMRARLLPEAIGPDYDLLVLTEAFADSARRTLLEGLAKLGYRHSTRVLGGRPMECVSRNAFREIRRLRPPRPNGGICLVSRWPLLDVRERIFQRRIGLEVLAQKGYVSATVLRDDLRFHVIALHAQANDGVPALRLPGGWGGPWYLQRPEAARQQQFLEIQGFAEGLRVAAEEPLFFAGDFNVDRDGPEYPAMLEALDATFPDGDQPLTIDTRHNHFLRRDRDPEFLRWLGGSPIIASDRDEFADYILVARGRRQPVEARVDTVRPLSPAWAGRRFDLSDHFAVAGSFRFQA